MAWKLIVTDTFSKEFKKYKKNKSFIDALDKILEKLKERPEEIGGHLSGKLKGKKSTRILGKHRLVFKIDSKMQVVYLFAIDHRKSVYK